MADSVFNVALARLQQLPEPEEAARLRTALERYEVEASWTVLSSRLKALPGSHSHKNYFSAYKDLLAWAEAEELSLLDPPAHFGPEYQQYLEQKYQASLASINTRLSQARRFYKLFRQLGVVPANLDPFSILVRSRVVPGEHRVYYSDAEVTRLLAQADLADRVLVLLGAHAGLTTAEVSSLTWAEVQLADGRVTLSGRELPLSEDLYRALLKFSEQQAGGVLFTSTDRLFDFQDQNALRARVYGLCLKANVPYRAWRGLRHAAGLRFYQQHGDLEQVARFLGVENHHLVRMYQTVSEADGDSMKLPQM